MSTTAYYHRKTEREPRIYILASSSWLGRAAMLARQPAAQLLRRLASSGAVQSCRAFADVRCHPDLHFCCPTRQCRHGAGHAWIHLPCCSQPSCSTSIGTAFLMLQLQSVAAEAPDAPPILGAAFLERFPVSGIPVITLQARHHEHRDQQRCCLNRATGLCFPSYGVPC